MIGEFETMHSGWCGRYEMDRYCVTYVWDDGENTGIYTAVNLTKKQAEHRMKSLEKDYPSLVKYACMAKMVEVIR